MKFSTKLAALVIGFCLAAAPAFALDGGGNPNTTTDTAATDTTATDTTTVTILQPNGTPQGPPTTIPPAYGPTNNPGSSHQPPANARALGRIECQEFKGVFDAPPRNEFGKCIAAIAKAIHLDLNPSQACSNLSRKRQEGERRSNFSACVVAATRALNQISA